MKGFFELAVMSRYGVVTSASEQGPLRPLFLNVKVDQDEIQERHYCHVLGDEQSFCWLMEHEDCC